MSRNNAEYVANLRKLADWLELHPEAPVDGITAHAHFGLNHSDDERGRREVRELAGKLGLPVSDDEHDISVSIEFGRVNWYAMYIYRAAEEQYLALNSYRGSVQPVSTEEAPAEAQTAGAR